MWIRDQWRDLEAQGVQVKAERCRRIRAAWPFPQKACPSDPTLESTANRIAERHTPKYE